MGKVQDLKDRKRELKEQKASATGQDKKDLTTAIADVQDQIDRLQEGREERDATLTSAQEKIEGQGLSENAPVSEEHAARVAGRKHTAQQRHREQLVQLEGQESFDRRQDSVALVHRLASEQRLSRMVYVAEKPAA